jgi:8-oxo-dGTP diphosphatase
MNEHERSGLSGRKVTEVAVGVLLRADGAVLLADRPAGKAYAGYWEFPGGKVEAGETVAVALARELREEIGVEIGPSAPWVTFEFDYPHAYVRLHFERVYAWTGTPQAHEGQRLAFHALDAAAPAPLLPAAIPALRWLRLPDLLALDEGGLAGARLVSCAALRDRATRPDASWAGAFVETRADVERAASLQYDFVLAGPVRAPSSQVGRAIGWDGFAALAHGTPLPVYVYGGVDRSDLTDARARGAHGIAVPSVAAP